MIFRLSVALRVWWNFSEYGKNCRCGAWWILNDLFSLISICGYTTQFSDEEYSSTAKIWLNGFC